MGAGIRLKGIKRKKVKGHVYVYRVVRGRYVRMPDLPENSPEFLRAYLEAESIVPQDKSIASLIEVFLASASFKTRKQSTRAVWRRRLDFIREAYGKVPVDGLQVQHVNRALQKLSPGAARSERTIWRALMAFAVSEGWRYDNPAKDAVTARYTSIPHPAWTPEEVALFRAQWDVGTPERQAFESVFWTGARCIDAVRLGWQSVDEGMLSYTQEKTGGSAHVPVLLNVGDKLEADRKLFLACAAPDMLFIQTRNGKARSVKSLSQFISKSAQRVGISKTAHGLRKSRAVILSEAGWTPHQIGAWTGHESLQEIAHYTKDANKKAMIAGKQAGKLSAQSEQVIEFRAKNR